MRTPTAPKLRRAQVNRIGSASEMCRFAAASELTASHSLFDTANAAVCTVYGTLRE